MTGMGDPLDAGQGGELLRGLGGVVAGHHDDGRLAVEDGGLEAGFSRASGRPRRSPPGMIQRCITTSISPLLSMAVGSPRAHLTHHWPRQTRAEAKASAEDARGREASRRPLIMYCPAYLIPGHPPPAGRRSQPAPTRQGGAGRQPPAFATAPAWRSARAHLVLAGCAGEPLLPRNARLDLGGRPPDPPWAGEPVRRAGQAAVAPNT